MPLSSQDIQFICDLAADVGPAKKADRLRCMLEEFRQFADTGLKSSSESTENNGPSRSDAIPEAPANPEIPEIPANPEAPANPEIPEIINPSNAMDPSLTATNPSPNE